jgi:phosphopantothenoylcysteine decarboxylase/phosphopantothenate--cysteine ligase
MVYPAPLILAPAMNVEMWRNEATQAALQALRARGALIVEPQSGYLACGDVGEGRLASPEHVATAVEGELSVQNDLRGCHILVNAGPTREYLDPVRFVSSPSSGLTGYELASEAARRGARVTLVSGPVPLPAPVRENIEFVPVTSALEMLEACREPFATADAALFTAAVADFRPAARAPQKVKKAAASLNLAFVPNPDIVATLTGAGSSASSGGGEGAVAPVPTAGVPTAPAQKPYVVAFAAETEDVLKNAQAKLAAKGADLIVANDVSSAELGFASRENRVWFVEPQSDISALESTGIVSKRELARLIVSRVVVGLARRTEVKH